MHATPEQATPAPVRASNAPNPQGLPTHRQLLIPLLQVIADAGGEMTPLDAIAAVAAYMGISADVRDAAVSSGRGKWEGRKRFVFRNRVAWTRMDAVEREYIDNTSRGKWKLTAKAKDDLVNIRPGFVLKVYETPSGTALWATAEAAAGVIGDSTVNLVFTSSAYALSRGKKYGNLSGAEFVQWLVNCGRDWRRMLVDDGSLILNLGAAWEPGKPCQSAYQERVLLAFLDELNFSYAQRLTWYNPCKMPMSPWVTQQRIRLNSADEVVYWLGKTDHPFADTKAVLRPYSEQHLKRLARGQFPEQGRPSRSEPRARGGNHFKNDGGSIPHSVLTMANSKSDAYLRRCREIGIKPHGARMPLELADFMVRLTTRPGDLVYDPFMGSNTVGFAAERLGRRWIGNDISLSYVAGSSLRFEPSDVAFNADTLPALESVCA